MQTNSKTVQDALDNINKHLGNKQFNCSNKNVFFDIITAIQQPITAIIPAKDSQKQPRDNKKQSKKKKKVNPIHWTKWI